MKILSKISRQTLIIYFLILLLGTAVRLYRLGEIPPGVNRDEASIGYTAYSLLKTGRDEYGRTFPVSFESFGDWKLPAYIYISIPFIWVFGLTDFAIRLPSALAGIGTIALCPILAYLLTGKRRVSLIAMFLLAVSPWHIHFSRVTYETNLAVFFMTLSSILFLLSVSDIKLQSLFIGSAILAALTLYTYHGNHIFTTLIVISVLIIYFRKLIRIPSFPIGALTYAFFGFLIFLLTFFGADKTKIAGIGIFGTPGIIQEKIEIPRSQHVNPNSIVAKIVHNQLTYGINTVTSNYLLSFSPEFLFFKGGTNHAHNIGGFGNMYYVEVIFLLSGIFWLIANIKTGHSRIILLWLFISPMAASITKDAPNSARMFSIFPILPVITALGLNVLIERLNNRILIQLFIRITFFLLLSLNILTYFDQYFIHFPVNEAKYWGIGYRKLFQELSLPQYSNKIININHTEYSPYIFHLFYSKYDPLDFQKSVVRYPPTPDSFNHVKKYANYLFTPEGNMIDDYKSRFVYVNINQDQTRSDSSDIKVLLPDNKIFATIRNIE